MPVHIYFFDSNEKGIPLEKIREECNKYEMVVHPEEMMNRSGGHISLFQCMTWVPLGAKNLKEAKENIKEWDENNYMIGAIEHLEKTLQLKGFGSCRYFI